MADLEHLHTAISDLAKLYVFRSRDDSPYFGVTVARAYTLRALCLLGETTMTDLAREVTVPVGTMTGVVDELVLDVDSAPLARGSHA